MISSAWSHAGDGDGGMTAVLWGPVAASLLMLRKPGVRSLHRLGKAVMASTMTAWQSRHQTGAASTMGTPWLTNQ